jgi:hypothetical protein
MINKKNLKKSNFYKNENNLKQLLELILENIDKEILKNVLEKILQEKVNIVKKNEIDNNLMKIFYYYNNIFLDMKENFEESMKDPWDKNILKMDEMNEYGRVAGGYNGWLGKIRWCIEAFKKTKPNEIFVYSDTDIIFYKPAISSIKEQMKNKEILFGKENFKGEINGGFITIRNCKNCLDFFILAEKIILSQSPNLEKNDQHIFQEIINKKLIPINWGVLDNRFWNRSLGFENLSKDIILHHANCTINKESKYKQFEEVKYKLYGIT